MQYAELFGPRQKNRKIILGDSAAAHGIDPSFLGNGEFYNFAFDGSGPLTFERWYQTFVRYQGPASLVLFSVDWFYFNGLLTRDPNSDSEYWPLSLWFEHLVKPGNLTPGLVVSRFPLLKYKTDIQQKIFRQGETRKVLVNKYHRGYAPWWIKERGTTGPPPYHVSKKTIATFERLLDRMNQDGTRVIMVQTPEYTPVGGKHAAEDRIIKAIALKRGISLLNYNGELQSEMNLDFSKYIDWPHLNEAGSQAFSRRLGHDLIPHLLKN